MALVAVVLGAGFGKDSGSQRPAAGRQPSPPPGHVTWILSGDDLALLRDGNAGLGRRYFDNRDTFVVGKVDGAQDMVPRGFRSIPTLSYASLRAFEDDVHFGRIDPRIGAVIYDPEAWGRTPAVEQEAPVASMRRFNRLASHWGYGAIVAPGRDLALDAAAGCAKHTGEILDQAYLRCGLIAGAGTAEGFVIQAAPEELELDKLHSLLRRARLQLRVQSPQALGLASLSTAPPGADEPTWPIDLLRAARLELAHVPGIMLNFTPATTEVAASFLRDLERERLVHGLLVARRD
ncbi:MAG TPA: hypothetical protein VLL27_12720 [Solirubrobacterales bacterium]|nr:hypothetical protein [Solirubrobacterales bacterium]